MRLSAIGVVALLSIWPLGAASRDTVQTLEAALAGARSANASDDETARRVAGIDLKERLAAATLARLLRGAGERTKLALELLADRSAFLEPPASEIPPGAPPSPAEQQAILDRAQAYTLHYVRVLPNLLCTQIVRRFDDFPSADEKFVLRDTITGELTVRNGAESFRPKDVSLSAPVAESMTTSGEFGSILATLFVARGKKFAWRRWETLDGRRAAVFGYSVAKSDSRFTVSWCCPPVSVKTAYKGELSVDPASGAVLRVMTQAVHLPGGLRIRRSDTVVEYRPVKLGRELWLFPFRSVTAMDEQEFEGFQQTPVHHLNGVEYTRYRRFEAESKLSFDVAREPLPAPAPGTSEAEAPDVSAELPLPGASLPPPPEEAAPPQPPACREVAARVVLKDAFGHAVANLRQEDFQLFDDEKLQRISGFRVESGSVSTPRSTVLVFDDLSLTFVQLSRARLAAQSALKDLAGPGGRLAVVTTSGKRLDFTDDLAKVQEVLDGPAPAGGPSDAPSVLSATEDAERRLGQMPGERSMVVVHGFVPTAALQELNQQSERVAAKGIAVSDVDARESDVAAFFKRVAAQPEATYVLTFCPADLEAHSGIHRLRVAVRRGEGPPLRDWLGSYAADQREEQAAPAASAVKVVTVRVVVTDERGRAVGNLHQEDFELFGNGKRQEIAGFHMEGRAAGKTGAGSVVYLFDDLNMTLRDSLGLRRAIERAGKDLADPGTRVAVTTTSADRFLDFTDDRAKVEAAMKQPESRERIMASAMNPPGPPAALGALAALHLAERRLEGAPGRRSIVFVSPGFVTLNPGEADLRPYLNEVIETADREGIAIDTLDARGVTAGRIGGPAGGDSSYDALWQRLRGQALAEIAAGSGGVFTERGKDLGTPPEFVYVLTFAPAAAREGAFQKLKVAVRNGKRLTVRARSGYFAPKPTD